MTSHRTFRTACLLALSFAAGCAIEPTDDPTDSPDDETADIAESADVLAVDPPDPTAEMVMTPSGLVHRSCVQEIAEGDTVEEDGTVTRADGSSYALPDCGETLASAQIAGPPPPADNGWIEFVDWHSSHYMKSFHGNFRVPSNPRIYGNQLIYLFPSFTGGAIIQPVLQWGRSPAGGGQYWAIASWYVWGNHYVHGPLKRVSVGDILYGSMTASSCASNGHCTWTIVTQDKTHAAKSTLKTKTGYKFTQVQGGVLEAYNVDVCNQYPTNHVEGFYNLAFKSTSGTVHPSWRKVMNRHTCHESVVASSSLVFLNWQ